MNFLHRQPDDVLYNIVSFLAFRPDTNHLQIASKHIHKLEYLFDHSGHQAPHGIHIVNVDCSYRDVLTFRDGQQHGPTSCYLNGTLVEYGAYDNNQRHGRFVHYGDVFVKVDHFEHGRTVNEYMTFPGSTDLLFSDHDQKFWIERMGGIITLIKTGDQEQWQFNQHGQIIQAYRYYNLRRSSRKRINSDGIIRYEKESFHYGLNNVMKSNKTDKPVSKRRQKELPTLESLGLDEWIEPAGAGAPLPL